MTAMTRKICIIGDFAVGKTSTVARFVHNVFSEKYLTTVGVKIDTRSIETGDGQQVKLVIWDIAGTDRFTAVEFSYLRGASGYLLVVDGTRGETLPVARKLRAEAEERYGELPFITLLNKSDLSEEWDISDEQVAALEHDGYRPIKTSAKAGDNVEKALLELAALIA